MRRNWKDVLMLLDVSERLAGHPNLKGIRDEAIQDLNELVSDSQPQSYPPRVGPSDMAGATPLEATGPMGPELEPDEHVQDPLDHDQDPPKINPELDPPGSMTDPVIRRKLP